MATRSKHSDGGRGSKKARSGLSASLVTGGRHEVASSSQLLDQLRSKAGESSRPIIPVILSGGSGTRLWPRSRAMYPKQFIRFFEDNDDSFLGTTLKRLPTGSEFADPILMCSNDHRFLVQEELNQAGVDGGHIVLEPASRNTAPAIAIAALIAERKNRDATIVVMPSDHVIKDPQAFSESILKATEIADMGRLVLFGIPPESPNTGYGYIQKGKPLPESDEAFAVERFMEKPDLETAERYVADGSYFWNSGIFVLNVRTFIEELRYHAPAILAAAEAALEDCAEDLGFLRLGAEAYKEAPNVSVDYAIMEHTSKAVMIPMDVGWSDVGSWSSLWEIAPHDEDDNYASGEVVMEDTHGSYIFSEKSLVATLGVEDLIIVDTADALLVAKKSRSQEISDMVKKLRAQSRKEEQQHVRNARPWGFFETLSNSPRFQVKKLHVKPGAKLSMQMHHHRSEHWIVVKGTACCTIDDVATIVRENESVYISATQWHRLENPGKVPLEIIEVQIGSYLGEDDIVRSEDIYHRDPDETR